MREACSGIGTHSRTDRRLLVFCPLRSAPSTLHCTLCLRIRNMRRYLFRPSTARRPTLQLLDLRLYSPMNSY
jgi:hypothetical protein